MGNSPYPALDIKPVESPVQQFGQAVGVMDALQQVQMNKIKLQEARQKQAEDTYLTQLHRQNQGNLDKTIQDATASGQVRPQTILSLQKQNLEMHTALAAATEKDLDNALKSGNLFAGALDAVKAVPEPNRPQELQNQIAGLAARGIPIQNVIKQIGALPNLSDDTLSGIEAGLIGHNKAIENENQRRTSFAAQTRANASQSEAATAAAKLPGELNQQNLTAQKTQLEINTFGQPTAKDIYVQNQENIRASNQRAATFANQLQFNALKDVNTMAADPQHGFGQFVSQANATKDAILQSKNGSQLASNLEPLMVALGITSFAGVHRINQVEVNAAGSQVGSAYRRINAILDKVGSGSVPAASLKEASDLVDGMIAAKHASLVTQADTVISNANNNSGPKQPKLDKKNIVISTPDGRGTMSLADALAGKGGDNTQGGQPAGATMKVPGSDGKLHWSDGKRDLGIAQ